MATLPDPNTLDSFIWDKPDGRYGGAILDGSVKIDDYVIDAAKWNADPAETQNTVQGVLSQNIDTTVYRPCINCSGVGDACQGQECLDWWTTWQAPDNERKIESTTQFSLFSVSSTVQSKPANVSIM